MKLLDPESPDKSLATWMFFDAYPVKWEVSKFDAEQSEIIVETLELAYTYFHYTPNG